MESIRVSHAIVTMTGTIVVNKRSRLERSPGGEEGLRENVEKAISRGDKADVE